MSNQQIPIACDMTALPNREKHLEVSATLIPQCQSVAPSETGYILSFPIDSLTLIAEFVDGERRCCPFIHFKIEVAPQAQSVLLHLSGAEGVKEFLEAELLSQLPI